VDDFFTDDIATIYPDIQTSGKEDFKKLFLLPLFNAFPDLKFVSLEVITQGFTIVQRWTLSGTFLKDFKGFVPNKKKITWQGISFVYINDDGKINMIRSIYDQHAFLEALGQKEQH